MPTFPGSLVPWVQQTFVDTNGDPVADGTVTFKVTGTNTDKDTFSDSDLDPSHVNTNPVQLDSGGRPESGAIFLEAGGYDVTLKDATGATIWTVSGVEDVGQTFLATWGQTMAEGEKDAPDDYVITDDDITVTGLPTTTGLYYLPQVTTRSFPLTFVNLSTTVDAILTPNGLDTINGVAGTVTIPAGTSPIFSGVTMVPDVANANWIFQAYWES